MASKEDEKRRLKNTIFKLKAVNRLSGVISEEANLSEKERIWHGRGWYRKPSDYKTEVVTVSVPFQPTSKKKVVLNKFRYLSAPFRKKNSEFEFIERTPSGSESRFGVECVRSDEFTHKGIPCNKINRSPKRGGVYVPQSEFKPPKSKRNYKRYIRPTLGKAVDMRNFRR